MFTRSVSKSTGAMFLFQSLVSPNFASDSQSTVKSFYQFVSLRMIRGREQVFNLKLFHQFFNHLVFKMSTTVRQYLLRTFMSTDNSFIQEICSGFSIGIWNSLCFWPFGQVIHSHNNVLIAIRGQREGSYKVNSNLIERAVYRNGM